MADEQSQPLRVSLDVRIDAHGYGPAAGSISLREEFSMPVADFGALAKILGQFHDLAQKVKADSG